MISHELRCILVHVQKTGGSSIRAALQMQQFDSHKHRFAVELRAIYGPEVWQRYFKLAFVRNPWDRLVSWWEMIRRNASEGRPMNGFQKYVASRARTFDEFIRHCDADCRDPDGSKCIYRNQLDYLTDADGQIIVDFIGRFERLDTDFGMVAQRLGLSAVSIPHLNRSAHPSYARYYSAETRHMVAEHYRRDIDFFGYSFEPLEAGCDVL